MLRFLADRSKRKKHARDNTEEVLGGALKNRQGGITCGWSCRKSRQYLWPDRYYSRNDLPEAWGLVPRIDRFHIGPASDGFQEYQGPRSLSTTFCCLPRARS